MPGALFPVDSNVWIAAIFTTHPFHKEAQTALQDATPANPAIFCRSTQLSLLRLASTPALLKTYGAEGLTNQDALVALDDLLALAQVTARDVVGVMEALIAQRGAPEHLRSDKVPEFIARALRDWLERTVIQALYITPGSPWENAYCESFNSRFQDEFLNREEFTSELEAKVLSAEWRRDYNEMRPHSALGGQTPAGFGARRRASTPTPTQSLIAGGTEIGGLPEGVDPENGAALRSVAVRLQDKYLKRKGAPSPPQPRVKPAPLQKGRCRK